MDEPELGVIDLKAEILAGAGKLLDGLALLQLCKGGVLGNVGHGGLILQSQIHYLPWLEHPTVPEWVRGGHKVLCYLYSWAPGFTIHSEHLAAADTESSSWGA